MATVTEEAAPAVAAEKVDEVKETPKPEEGEAPRAEEGQEGKKAEDGEGTKAEKKPRKRKPKSAGPHHPPYFEVSEILMDR
jgi:histone H1/5